jgi:hypothetical protein
MFIEQLHHARFAAAKALIFWAHEKIDDHVASNPKEPIPKSASLGIRSPPVNGAGHCQENFLSKLLGVGVLQPFSPRQPVKQR